MDASSTASAVQRPGRGRVFDSIVDAIGDTPIVRLRKLPQAAGAHATILAKLEYFNPAASVKDRIGAAMIIAMEKTGHINFYFELFGATRDLPSFPPPRSSDSRPHPAPACPS